MQPVSSSLSLTHRPHPETPDGLVTAWLLLCCLLIFAMAVIGAVTRLTDSGLSIMEWAPIVGIVPPLSQQEWERIFALYRQIPEYQEINAGMTLAEFKGIFWWEWLHRFWGRLIAIVFALPFFWFLWSARLRGPLAWKLGLALLLGALQGALGWYMVASGFAERTDVSQYRLVAHLALALAIYGWLLWIAFEGLAPAPAPSYGPHVWTLSRGLVAFLILLAVTLMAGGFVAGLNAGLTYNSFPLMDGRWIPGGYGLLEPWYRNSFENVTAVQFNHRLLATLTLLLTIALATLGATQGLSVAAWRALLLLPAMALAQFGLGVATLLWVVPVPLAAAHQAGALLLLSVALWALHQLRPGGTVTPPGS